MVFTLLAILHGSSGSEIHLCGRWFVVRWVVGSIPHGWHVELLLIPAWYKKVRGMCYPVCGILYIKNRKRCPWSDDSVFPLSLSDWSFTICPLKYNVLSVSLNKTFLSFLPGLFTLFCFYSILNHFTNHIHYSSPDSAFFFLSNRGVKYLFIPRQERNQVICELSWYALGLRSILVRDILSLPCVRRRNKD